MNEDKRQPYKVPLFAMSSLATLCLSSSLLGFEPRTKVLEGCSSWCAGKLSYGEIDQYVELGSGEYG